jgi:hypothetical protein
VDYQPQPAPIRLALGFALAPTIPAALISFGKCEIFLFALKFSLGSTLLLGGPIYLMLRHRTRPSMWKILLIGGVLGMVAIYVAGSLHDVVFGFMMGLIGGVIFWLCVVCGDPRLSSLQSR